MAAEQNIRIIWEEKEVTHWNLIGSPVHVKRILMNILSNAVKYTKKTDMSISAVGKSHRNRQQCPHWNLSAETPELE